MKTKYIFIIPQIILSNQIHRDKRYNGGWGPGGGGNEELVLNGYRVSVWEDEKSSGDGWR